MTAASAPLSYLEDYRPPEPYELEKRAAVVRQDFARLPTTPPTEALSVTDQPLPGDGRQIVERSAELLDFVRVLCGICSAIEIARIASIGELRARASEVSDLLRAVTRIDPTPIMTSSRAIAYAARAPKIPSDDAAALPKDVHEALIRFVKSLLAACPVDTLVYISKKVGRPESGHKCRLAFEWLTAYVRRHETRQDNPALHEAGEMYAVGKLTVSEVARLTGMPKPDGVHWLEENGYARDLGKIALSADERVSRLEIIHRNMNDEDWRKAVSSPEREVIASQRIEDVDARPWINSPVG